MIAAPLLSNRVANVFLRLWEETSVTPARQNVPLPALGKISPQRLRFGQHRDLREGILESSRRKNTIRVIGPVSYGPHGEPKDSVDQHNGRTTVYDLGAYQNPVTCQ